MNIGAGIQTVTTSVHLILTQALLTNNAQTWDHANASRALTNKSWNVSNGQTNKLICFHRQKYSAACVIAKYYSWMRFGAVLKLPHKHDDGPSSSLYTAACCSHFRKMRKVKGKNMCTTTPMNHWRRQKIIKNVIEMTAARRQDWYLL